MIIGVDVDEVLANLHDPWTTWIEERHGISADWSDWHIDRTTGLGGKVFSFINSDIYTDGTVEPYPEAHGALARLREHGYTIWFTTSCINNTEEAKLDWLKGYGLWTPDDLYVPGRDKRHPSLRYLIDDRFRNCADALCPAILINREWNQKHPWYWRADDVAHAVDMILDEDKYTFLT